ncbi:MAG: transposase, partial [Thiobacillus sp.]
LGNQLMRAALDYLIARGTERIMLDASEAGRSLYAKLGFRDIGKGSKPLFWHRAYYVGSVGGATLDTVRAYVDAQGTEEHARKKHPKIRPPA